MKKMLMEEHLYIMPSNPAKPAAYLSSFKKEHQYKFATNTTKHL